MNIFSGFKKKQELVLVFNIGSSSIDGALILAQESGIPKIIFSVSESIQFGEKVSSERFALLTVRALGVVARKIHEENLGRPLRVFCVLSSHWCFSETRVIHLKKNTPFIFTEKIADELIKKEIKLIESEHSTKHGAADKGVRIIELKNIKTMLNGYETLKPLDQKARELEMTVFVSVSGEEILQRIEVTIARYFNFKQIRFSSFALSSFTVVRDMYMDQENFILVDIGGEITDIFMVKKNTLRESISFPLGRNFLIRGVASDLACTLGEANSMISLLKDGHAEKSVVKKLEPIMSRLREKWLKKFQESLVNLSDDVSIPFTIYAVIDKDLADFFSETIKSEQFSQYTLTESKFEVVLLGTKLFHGIASFERDVIREPFIIIDTVYINRFLINSSLPLKSGKKISKK